MISNKIIAKEFFMELVYLWVDKYKNIDKQGFNFSPRFRCDYDEDTKELNIIDKEETGEFYPKNFFGDNINVTAIVGENGSGKSNLIELLTTNNRYICYFIVIKTDILYFINKTGKKIKTDILDYNPSNKLFSKLDFDYLKFTPDDTHFFGSLTRNNDDNIDKEINEGSILINKYKHNKKINRLLYKYQNIFNSFFNKNVTKLEIKQNNLSRYPLPDNYINEVSSTYISSILYILKENKDLKTKDYIKQKYEELIDGNKEKYFDKNSKINLNELDEKVIEFLLLSEIQDYLEIKFYDENDICIFDFSQGERQLLQQFIKIQDDLFENDNNIVMCLDEPTNTFHPNWQKEYISKLISVFGDSFTHFIITSHSPFILSDLAKENIIFLEKDEKTGNCMNATDKVDINPFGANIHTLLSHGFFMKDGLMGKFAKSKIDLAIKYLNQKVLTPTELDYCENIISIIGEPIIKRELQKMLDSKKLSEIEQIKKEIKALEERMTLIWKNSK